ncbi:MAG: hypothetical protein ABI995_01250 [Acidobacteriota bacterium]
MLVVFVHGWGVRRPDYGPLPESVRQSLGSDTVEVRLSEYVSYNDHLTIHDLATAFERARQNAFPNRPFACVTHSTGGVILRAWLAAYGGPLTHLVMLAPPHHGSALAQLGKSRLSRMKCWFDGVDPGQRILDSLELGSRESWALNLWWLNFDWAARGTYPFVLTGSAPDRSLYDHLNSYTGEPGSDGVVRAASANLNFTLLRFQQTEAGVLELVETKRPLPTAFGILPGTSHTGILHSATTADWLAQCLRVKSLVDYRDIASALAVLTQDEPLRCSILAFRTNVDDYDLLFTAGPDHSPDALPSGFFIDRQRNSRQRDTLTYFVNHTPMTFQLRPRPESGPVSFALADFRGASFIRPHETSLVEVTCHRRLQDRVFAFPSRKPRRVA